jgi:predicted ATPase with chaperone activity
MRGARDQVRAAVLSSGLPWLLGRVTANLAPAGVALGIDEVAMAKGHEQS